MSSIWIPLSTYLVGSAADALINSLSLIPNLHSGIPDNFAFITTYPTTSDHNNVPLFEIRTLTFSMMSMKSSFFLYLMFSALHGIAPVA